MDGFFVLMSAIFRIACGLGYNYRPIARNLTMDHLPNNSGVYQIKRIFNNKIYIGSALDIRYRCEQHRRSLRRGDHSNPHLQAAWDKYGEGSFEFTALEITDKDDRLGEEQKWLDGKRSFDRDIGFNIFDTAGSPGDAFAQTWEGFIDPEGNEVIIRNLFDFCRENNLDFPSITGFINPNGERVILTNLQAS
ncbi:MAG: GIY-YIG nuclease family protein [Rhodospirillales bacterium]|nr:GIY-YIG nuclease family protein [Rhodospirillales bacterium]